MAPAGGNGFHITAVGPEDGDPIVFCHPLGGSSAVWRELVAILGGRFRCIGYDASGHGATPAMATPPRIEALANDLAAALDQAGLTRAHIAGVSIGGMVAQSFAALYPERVDRLVLMATTPKMPEPAMWTDRAAEVRRDGLDNVASAAMQRWFTPAFASAHPERVEETRRLFLATDVESYALACEAIAAMDLTEAIARIAARTLVMAAADDPSTPLAVAETLRSAIPGATSIVVPKAAHLMMIEKPSEVAAWLTGFLGLPDDAGPA